ncbi:hypothetical protein ACQ4PT_003434 [Festuca glaucescens]
MNPEVRRRGLCHRRPTSTADGEDCRSPPSRVLSNHASSAPRAASELRRLTVVTGRPVAVLCLSASYGSHVCVNEDNMDTSALRDRFDGTKHPNELLDERGRRYGVLNIASGGSASVQMVLFGEVAREMIVKNANALLAESYDLFNAMPTEITCLVGRKYVCFLFRLENISFQVPKFYPEGSTVLGVGGSSPIHTLDNATPCGSTMLCMGSAGQEFCRALDGPVKPSALKQLFGGKLDEWSDRRSAE